MFRLRDFFHHPSVQTIIESLCRLEPGLVLVSGGEGIPHAALANYLGLAASDVLLPSGRGVIFRALLEEVLAANSSAKAVCIAPASHTERPSRQVRSRLAILPVNDSAEIPAIVRAAAARKPDVLVLESLPTAALPAALAVAAIRPVLGQLDLPLPASAIPQTLGLSSASGWHPDLRWVLSVQRLPALCSHCKIETSPTPEEKTWLVRAFAEKGLLHGQAAATGPFFTASGCDQCQHTGRSGDIAVLEAWYNPRAGGAAQCVLSMDAAIWHLVQDSGNTQLSLSDLVFWQSEQANRAYRSLSRLQHALELSLKTQQEQRSEIEAAQRVLEQRTQALFSLQSLGQALISSDDLAGLGKRICQRASELCGGELAVLYYLRSGQSAEILAVNGWPRQSPGEMIPAADILNWSRAAQPAPYQGVPPGITSGSDSNASPLYGLYVPLVAQQVRVGALILQSARQKVFHPGEVALLQTFANQAALALQRADLVDALLAKVNELEKAQDGLARKERLEREMELARQVQQSFLPHSFPAVHGVSFAARYQAADQVGGDFYDAFALPDGQIGLVVADVSDKGMPAALYMALTRSLLHAESQRQNSPGLVLQRVNQLLHDLGSSGMFVTIFYGILDIASGQLQYARAGHDRPVVLHASQATELPGKGLPLGLFTGEDFYLEEHTTALLPGDHLVMYSDGLTDAHAPGGELYERNRLVKFLEDNAALPSELLCEAVFAEILAHQQGSPPFDDMTLLVVQVTG